MFTSSLLGPFYVPDLVTLLLCWVEVGLRALKSTSLFKGKCCLCKSCGSKGRQFTITANLYELCCVQNAEINMPWHFSPAWYISWALFWLQDETVCSVFVNIIRWFRKVFFISRRALILLCRVCFNIHNLLENSFLSFLVVPVIKKLSVWTM